MQSFSRSSTDFLRSRLCVAVRATLVGTVIAALPLATLQAAQPAAQTDVRSYAIAAGPLADRLAEFAAAAGVQLYFDAQALQGLHTAGLRGTHAVADGFRTLLAGSVHEAVPNAAGEFTLRALPKGAAATLPLFKVNANAEQETATGRVQGYAARRSATGTKTDTPIIETPQSITVVSSDQITTLKAQSITDAIAYSVGPLRAPYAERMGDEASLRGFKIYTSFRDGSHYQADTFDGQQEPYGLERIEVLKGAASILYGAAAPGGILNTVSKRPTTETQRELNVEAGSFDRKQLSADFAGALSTDGAWSYRLTALERDSDTHIDHVPDDRTFVAPAVKWQPNEQTTLTLLAEYQHDRSAYGGAYPSSGTVLPNANGHLSRSLFFGEPDYDEYDVERYSVGYLFEHAFNANLTLRHSLRKYRMQQDYKFMTIANDFTFDQRVVPERFGYDRDQDNSRVTSDTSLQYDWQTTGITHKTLVGIDVVDSDIDTVFHERTFGPLDLFAPVYGDPGSAPVPLFGAIEDKRQTGVYVQNQMKIADKWVLLLGGRQDWVRQEECDSFERDVCGIDDEKTDAFSGRAGVVYLADNGLAPFASFSQSFESVAGVDSRGGRFEPTRGEQVEAGVRYQPVGSALMLSAAAYELTQSDVLTDDPDNENFQLQHGEVRSRGVELEARGNIGHDTQIIGVYAYTDARTTKASALYPEQEGERSIGIPYNQFSLWANHTLTEFGLAGVTLGAGVRHVGETTASTPDVTVPDFTVFDAMAAYATGPWTLSLNASNVTDKRYVASCPNHCFYGEPRKLIGAVSYRW